MHETELYEVSYFFPGLCAVGLASAVDRSLIFSEVNQRNGKTCKVGHVVVQKFCSIVHFVVEATVGHLQIAHSTDCIYTVPKITKLRLNLSKLCIEYCGFFFWAWCRRCINHNS